MVRKTCETGTERQHPREHFDPRSFYPVPVIRRREWFPLFKRHASYPNNPRIAEPFFFAKYIEKLGSGITDLIDACRAAELGDPEFDISAGTFNIVIHLRNGTNSIKLPEGSLKILEILAADSHCTCDVLAERLGISRRTVTKQISNLRKEGKLRRIGPDKGGHWEVIDGK